MDNKTAIKRPNLGCTVTITAIYHKYKFWDAGWSWAKWTRRELAVPKQGVYIGYRQVYDNRASWEDEDGWEHHRGDAYNLWLVVIDERKNPVYVSPHDVKPTD